MFGFLLRVSSVLTILLLISSNCETNSDLEICTFFAPWQAPTEHLSWQPKDFWDPPEPIRRTQPTPNNRRRRGSSRENYARRSSYPDDLEARLRFLEEREAYEEREYNKRRRELEWNRRRARQREEDEARREREAQERRKAYERAHRRLEENEDELVQSANELINLLRAEGKAIEKATPTPPPLPPPPSPPTLVPVVVAEALDTDVFADWIEVSMPTDVKPQRPQLQPSLSLLLEQMPISDADLSTMLNLLPHSRVTLFDAYQRLLSCTSQRMPADLLIPEPHRSNFIDCVNRHALDIPSPCDKESLCLVALPPSLRSPAKTWCGWQHLYHGAALRRLSEPKYFIKQDTGTGVPQFRETQGILRAKLRSSQPCYFKLTLKDGQAPRVEVHGEWRKKHDPVAIQINQLLKYFRNPSFGTMQNPWEAYRALNEFRSLDHWMQSLVVNGTSLVIELKAKYYLNEPIRLPELLGEELMRNAWNAVGNDYRTWQSTDTSCVWNYFFSPIYGTLRQRITGVLLIEGMQLRITTDADLTEEDRSDLGSIQIGRIFFNLLKPQSRYQQFLEATSTIHTAEQRRVWMENHGGPSGTFPKHAGVFELQSPLGKPLILGVINDQILNQDGITSHSMTLLASEEDAVYAQQILETNDQESHGVRDSPPAIFPPAPIDPSIPSSVFSASRVTIDSSSQSSSSSTHIQAEGVQSPSTVPLTKSSHGHTSSDSDSSSEARDMSKDACMEYILDSVLRSEDDLDQDLQLRECHRVLKM